MPGLVLHVLIHRAQDEEESVEETWPWSRSLALLEALVIFFFFFSLLSIIAFPEGAMPKENLASVSKGLACSSEYDLDLDSLF